MAGAPPGQRCAGPASPPGARRRLGACPATGPALAARAVGGIWAMQCGAFWGLAAVVRPSPRPRSWRLRQRCVFFVPVPVAPGRSRSRFRRCAVFSCSRQVAVLFPGALIRFPGPGAPGVSRSCLRPCRIFLSGPSCARQVVAPCPALLICFSGAQLPPAGRGPVSGCIDSLSQGDVTCPQHFAVLRPAAMIPGAQLHVAFYGLSSDCVDCSPGARRRQRVAVLSRRR